MTEESIQSFPRPEQNNTELVHIYIEGELKKAGIELQQINRSGAVTTDQRVPEETMSNIREYAASKGITIKFLTSE